MMMMSLLLLPFQQLLLSLDPSPFSISVIFVILCCLGPEESRSEVFGNQFPHFQRNYWYEYSSPPSTTYPEYIDYHFAKETSTQPPIVPTILNGPDMEIVKTKLGLKATMKCFVRHRKEKMVSWVRKEAARPNQIQDSSVPVLIAFGDEVYSSDIRIKIEHKSYSTSDTSNLRNSNSNNEEPGSGTKIPRWENGGTKKPSSEYPEEKPVEEFVLNILNAQKSDTGIYECQISTEPPKIHQIFLDVEAPVLTVLDGFGRPLIDQFYKVGSSLEVMCHVDRLPARPLPEVIELRHESEKLERVNNSLGQTINTEMKTEIDGGGAVSRLAIAQASVSHSGIYTCSVSDTISQSLRLHIIDESKPVPIINNSSSSLTGGGSKIGFFFTIFGRKIFGFSNFQTFSLLLAISNFVAARKTFFDFAVAR